MCGESESVQHFLLSCPRYDALRQRFLQNLPCPLTHNNLLYGKENLTRAQNEHIFLNVQRYIVATKRFNWVVDIYWLLQS